MLCNVSSISVIAGLEVELEHCTIENTNNSVTLTPIGEALKKLMGHIAFGACVGGCVRGSPFLYLL